MRCVVCGKNFHRVDMRGYCSQCRMMHKELVAKEIIENDLFEFLWGEYVNYRDLAEKERFGSSKRCKLYGIAYYIQEQLKQINEEEFKKRIKELEK